MCVFVSFDSILFFVGSNLYFCDGDIRMVAIGCVNVDVVWRVCNHKYSNFYGERGLFVDQINHARIVFDSTYCVWNRDGGGVDQDAFLEKQVVCM